MKICGLSDIHGKLIEDIPKCDVLCLCGDIIPLDIQRNKNQSITWWSVKFTDWVNKLKCKKVLVVPGNHDFLLEELDTKVGSENNYLTKVIDDLTEGKVTFLVNKEYVYDGIKFFGCPYIAPIIGIPGKWAFEDIEDESKFNNIPENVDVLLTHENPNYNYKLRNAVEKIKNLKLHLFGHWHDGISYADLKQQNCSLLNDSYNTRECIHIPTFEVEAIRRFSVEELLEDAQCTLMNEQLSGGDSKKIEELKTIRDFLTKYYRIENNINIDSNGD